MNAQFYHRNVIGLWNLAVGSNPLIGPWYSQSNLMVLLIVPFLIALTFSRHLSKRLPASTRAVERTIDRVVQEDWETLVWSHQRDFSRGIRECL